MAELVTRDDLLGTESQLQAMIETQTLRLTVRLGGTVAVGFGMLAASMGLFAFMLRVHS